MATTRKTLTILLLFTCLVEELTCLATWKDGNARYLVGLVSHHHATSNEERFRCFVYEKIQNSMGTYDPYHSKEQKKTNHHLSINAKLIL